MLLLLLLLLLDILKQPVKLVLMAAIDEELWRSRRYARPLPVAITTSLLHASLPTSNMALSAGSVGAVLALLLRGEEGTPKELGPVHCVAMAPAPPLTQPLASACDPFVTSVVLG